MKSARLSRILPILLLLAAGSASASGVNLSWDACTPEGGVQNKTFACNTNLGSRTMFGSFVLASDSPHAVGIVARVDITAAADSLPAWWRFDGPNLCRVGLSSSFSFVSDPNTDCVDPWSGQATGATAAYYTFWTSPQVPGGNPATAQPLLICAVRIESAVALSAGTEYYGFKLTLSSTKTVGSGACAGCSTPVCITLSEVEVDGSDNSTQAVTAPIVASTVTWQSAGQCPGSFSSQNVSWGQIRSVLR